MPSDMFLHGVWMDQRAMGLPLVMLDTYLAAPRHWRWVWHLGLAVALKTLAR